MKGTTERAQHYRDRAANLPAMVEIEFEDKPRRDLLALADQYDRLSRELMRHLGVKHPDDA